MSSVGYEAGNPVSAEALATVDRNMKALGVPGVPTTGGCARDPKCNPEPISPPASIAPTTWPNSGNIRPLTPDLPPGRQFVSMLRNEPGVIPSLFREGINTPKTPAAEKLSQTLSALGFDGQLEVQVLGALTQYNANQNEHGRLAGVPSGGSHIPVSTPVDSTTQLRNGMLLFKLDEAFGEFAKSINPQGSLGVPDERVTPK